MSDKKHAFHGSIDGPARLGTSRWNPRQGSHLRTRLRTPVLFR